MTAIHPIAPEDSKALFGNSYMHTVLVEITRHGDEPFSPKQIIDATGLPGGIIHPLIKRLKSRHFIEYLGRVPGEKTTLYQVRDNPYMRAAREYAEAAPEIPQHRAAN